MYNNSTQYPTGYQSAYPQYQQNYGSSYGYQGYGTQYSAQATQPVPPSEHFPTDNWNVPQTNAYAAPSQKDAVAQEMHQQKAQLVKQREDYVKKVSVLRRELEQLRIQKQELVGEGGADRDLVNILRENDKLQDEIQGKMKAIHNVIEMLSSIIKDGRSLPDLEASLCGASPPNYHNQISSSDDVNSAYTAQSQEKFCYVHYDTGLHWCWLCDEFPETAKDFLLHLQEKKHRDMEKENEVDGAPWHKLPPEPALPSDDNAPKRRIPIKGLQFFVAAPSWYCKLCDVWIGDLHCASNHLKSKSHFQNYENFVAQNPQWEMDWLKDREKALAKNGVQDSSDSEGKKKKKKRKEKRQSDIFARDKKRKKKAKKRKKRGSDSSSSSSSSEDSSSDEDKEDRSRSIRVAMRNMKQVQSIMEEDLTSKWNVLERLVEEHKKKEEKSKEREDPLINQWMTVAQPPEKDQRMLDDLKDRMKHKQEQEKAKQMELDKKKREKEREEKEELERAERAAREAEEEAERERKRKEQEELERIRNKERNQVRFKTNYRRRRSASRSDEEDHSPRHSHSHDKHKRGYRSQSRSSRSKTPDRRSEDNLNRKKPPGPPSYKKLPFIGRMPLFKNRKPEEKEERKEIQKESYEPPRRTRFQPGNLARAFIPKPDVVCFPKLSSIPPLTIPPPPKVVQAPAPPKITPPKPPPPPKIAPEEKKEMSLSDDEMLYAEAGEGVDANMMGQYYAEYYPHPQEYEVPHSHTMPLQPPPLPPDDDLAMLGICADDMAAQSF